jgi:cytochrome c oxidase subunit 2
MVQGPPEPHLDIVLNGKPGTAMAAFGPQLSDFDLAAVLSYERNAWHNQSGQPVQPALVAARRQ